MRIMALIILTLFILINLGITFASMRWLQVVHHVVYVPDLPSHLEGLRILQISDLHNRSSVRKTLNIWPTVFDQTFDIAVITGDIIVGSERHLEPHRYGLGQLAYRVPTFFIEGNHELRHRSLDAFMAEVGITFLRNDIATVSHGGGTFEVVGTRDYNVLTRDHFAVFDTLFDNAQGFQLVLTHQPQAFNYLKGRTAMPQLVLSGHTHGGQLRLPFFPTIYAPNQGFFPQYGSGFYHYQNATLYVSRGIGATNFSLRFWNRPELPIFELRKKD